MKLFGTDGIRAEAGKFPLDAATVYRIGRVLGRLVGARTARGVVGGDTRRSTPEILAAIARGLAAEGVALENAGVVPTPAVADLVRERGAAFGVAISASHNPWRDNGIKIFAADGRKLPDAQEAAIERALPSETGLPGDEPVPAVDPALAEAYRRHVGAAAGDLGGLPVLLDCAHGAAFEVAPAIFRDAGASVEVRGASPDGTNINEGCGAMHPEALSSLAASGRYRLAAAFDGDADRLVLADETGRVLDGDDVLWILARDLHRRGELVPPVVVGTVMTNIGLEQALSTIGAALVRTPVGDRHVVRVMQERGAALGGESSGHIIQSALSTTGDGILGALSVAALVVGGTPLSALADLRKAPQVLRNLRVGRRVPLDDVVVLARAVEEAERELDGRGRVLLRYSGTEPLLRVMVEGPDRAGVEAIAERLCRVAEAELKA
ncbi:MAG TPA: phosphoglucosamine mutase [Thermoanaerobaculia bacterium]|nr:phosphoglucosamine mutase [Thermoanaerobaculia bacterium]